MVHQSIVTLAKASLAVPHSFLLKLTAEAPINIKPVIRNKKSRKKPRDEILSSWHWALTSSPCHCEDSPDCPVLSPSLQLEALYEICQGSKAPDKGQGSAELTEKRKNPLICVGVPLPRHPPPFLHSLTHSLEKRSAQHRAGFGRGWTNSEAACTDPSQDLISWSYGFDPWVPLPITTKQRLAVRGQVEESWHFILNK